MSSNDNNDHNNKRPRGADDESPCGGGGSSGKRARNSLFDPRLWEEAVMSIARRVLRAPMVHPNVEMRSYTCPHCNERHDETRDGKNSGWIKLYNSQGRHCYWCRFQVTAKHCAGVEGVDCKYCNPSSFSLRSTGVPAPAVPAVPAVAVPAVAVPAVPAVRASPRIATAPARPLPEGLEIPRAVHYGNLYQVRCPYCPMATGWIKHDDGRIFPTAYRGCDKCREHVEREQALSAPTFKFGTVHRCASGKCTQECVEAARKLLADIEAAVAPPAAEPAAIPDSSIGGLPEDRTETTWEHEICPRCQGRHAKKRVGNGPWIVQKRNGRHCQLCRVYSSQCIGEGCSVCETTKEIPRYIKEFKCKRCGNERSLVKTGAEDWKAVQLSHQLDHCKDCRMYSHNCTGDQCDVCEDHEERRAEPAPAGDAVIPVAALVAEHVIPVAAPVAEHVIPVAALVAAPVAVAERVIPAANAATVPAIPVVDPRLGGFHVVISRPTGDGRTREIEERFLVGGYSILRDRRTEGQTSMAKDAPPADDREKEPPASGA